MVKWYLKTPKIPDITTVIRTEQKIIFRKNQRLSENVFFF